MIRTCPVCEVGKTAVLDTRDTNFGDLRRRRECKHCGHRFTTYELPVEDAALSTLETIMKEGLRRASHMRRRKQFPPSKTTGKPGEFD